MTINTINRLSNHYSKTIQFDLSTKLNLSNIYNIPKLKKISLNIGSLSTAMYKKQILPIIILLELITGQKSFLTKSWKNKILLKIKKGTIIGCKITLWKFNLYIFFEKLLLYILPNIKNFSGFKMKKLTNNIFTFKITNIFSFLELKQELNKFSNNMVLDITIETTSKTNDGFFLLLNSFNFPFQKINSRK